MGLVHQSPDRHGSVSHVSISGTCSSVWRTRDLPIAPISSTEAFSNRIDVAEERNGGGWWSRGRASAPTTERENQRLRVKTGNQEEEEQQPGTFQGV